MINRALTKEETYALVELIICRGELAQIRIRRRDGSICWLVVDPDHQTMEEREQPLVGIATYPVGVSGSGSDKLLS